MKRLSSSSWRQPNVLFSNIWRKQALQSLAVNELQRSIMYDQTGSLSALQAATILVAMASGKNIWRLKFWRKSPIGDLQI